MPHHKDPSQREGAKSIKEEKTSHIHFNTALFNDYYQINNNWQDDPEINFLQILQLSYPDYFRGSEPDYKKIAADVVNIKKARELFKNLFKMSFKTFGPIFSQELIEIVNRYGKKIIAHGVGEAKGGMCNLLLMNISNQVLVPSQYWDKFVKGPSNISPLTHGPYYLIYSTPFHKKSRPTHKLLLSDMVCILVPFIENREILIEQLSKMTALEMVTEERKTLFINKTKTYFEFLQELECQELQMMDEAFTKAEPQVLPLAAPSPTFFSAVPILEEKNNNKPNRVKRKLLEEFNRISANDDEQSISVSAGK